MANASPRPRAFAATSSSAVSTPALTVARQHAPDGFVVGQERPGSAILSRMSSTAVVLPRVRSSVLMLWTEWPKQ